MIKRLFNKYKKSKLVKDNLILFIGNSLGAFFTFLFHFYMGRKLGPSEYGALGAILALIYLFTIPLNTIQTSIAKFTSEFKSKNKDKEINYLLRRSLKKLSLYGIIGVIGFALLTPLISSYLHISIISLLILSLFILFALLLAINRGVLQGLQNFKGFSINLTFEGLIKLFLSFI